MKKNPNAPKQLKIVTAIFILMAVVEFYITVALLYYSWTQEMLPPTWLIFVILFLVFGIIFLVGAYAVYHQKRWGRLLGIALGVLLLPTFPLGTVLGIVVLYFLTNKNSTQLFIQPNKGEVHANTEA